MRKRVILLIILACVLMMLSCDKSSNPSGKGPILVKVKLVNSENEPLAGYNATIYPELNVEPLNNASDKSSAIICFTIPETSNIKVEIFDYYDNMLETLWDESLETGQHSLVYSPDNNVSDGIYKVEFTRSIDGLVKDFLTRYIYKYSKSTLGNDDYVTDENGEFDETNRYCFPYLYFNDEIECYSYDGSPLGNVSFSRQTCIKITNNEGLTKTATFNLLDMPNFIQLNWDEMTIENKKTTSSQVESIDLSSETFRLGKENDGGESPTETSMFVYPNPFD